MKQTILKENQNNLLPLSINSSNQNQPDIQFNHKSKDVVKNGCKGSGRKENLGVKERVMLAKAERKQSGDITKRSASNEQMKQKIQSLQKLYHQAICTRKSCNQSKPTAPVEQKKVSKLSSQLRPSQHKTIKSRLPKFEANKPKQVKFKQTVCEVLNTNKRCKSNTKVENKCLSKKQQKQEQRIVEANEQVEINISIINGLEQNNKNQIIKASIESQPNEIENDNANQHQDKNLLKKYNSEYKMKRYHYPLPQPHQIAQQEVYNDEASMNTPLRYYNDQHYTEKIYLKTNFMDSLKPVSMEKSGRIRTMEKYRGSEQNDVSSSVSTSAYAKKYYKDNHQSSKLICKNEFLNSSNQRLFSKGSRSKNYLNSTETLTLRSILAYPQDKQRAVRHRERSIQSIEKMGIREQQVCHQVNKLKERCERMKGHVQQCENIRTNRFHYTQQIEKMQQRRNRSRELDLLKQKEQQIAQRERRIRQKQYTLENQKIKQLGNYKQKEAQLDSQLRKIRDRQIQLEKERKKQQQKLYQISSQKQRQIDMQLERERERVREKERLLDRERMISKERQVAMELEREKQRERKRMVQIENQRIRQAERQRERQWQRQRSRQISLERQRQLGLIKSRQTQRQQMKLNPINRYNPNQRSVNQSPSQTVYIKMHQKQVPNRQGQQHGAIEECTCHRECVCDSNKADLNTSRLHRINNKLQNYIMKNMSNMSNMSNMNSINNMNMNNMNSMKSSSFTYATTAKDKINYY